MDSIPNDYGIRPPPSATAQEGHPDDGPTEQERSTPFEPTVVGQTPLEPTTNTRSATTRQLLMDDLPSKHQDETCYGCTISPLMSLVKLYTLLV